MISLYVKIHNITGLKYFGKTIKNPYIYKGSGVYWKNHLAKHGNDVTTIVVGEYLENSNLLAAHAMNFSIIHNIVCSKDWANLINENGSDGNCPGTVFSKETRDKIGKASIGRYSPKKGKTYKEYFGDRGEEIINKMKSSKYHQASSYEIRFGTIKAAQIKKRISKQTSGSNNPNAAVWLLTNPQGDTVELFNLKEDLNNLALPYGTLKDSYRYNRAVKRGIAKDWQLKRK